MGLRAFGIIGPQIHIDEAPLEAVGNLRAQPVDVVIVAVDAHDTGTVDGGVQHFCGFEICRNENAGIETLLRCLRGNGIREISG